MGALLWRRGITAVAAVCWLLFQPVHAFQPTDEPTLLLDQAQSTLVAKPIEGLRLAREATALEESGVAPRDAIMMRAAWLEAESLFRLSLPGDAAEVLKETLSTYRNAGETALYGKLLITSARVARSFGDNGLALKNFQDAYKLFSELGVTRYQAMALQGISTLYTNARRYERAIEYDRRAAEIHPNDPIMKIASLNNRGYALRKLGRFDEARSMFEEALNLDIIPEVPSLGVRLYANIAAMELAAGDIDRVRAALRGQEKLAANLSKDQAPLLLAAVQAEIAYRDGERTEAEAILDEAFLGVDLEETPEDAIEAHALAAKTYENIGASQKALAQLKAFQRLDDLERDIAASANSAINNATFELSAKELVIEKLRSEKLEADVKLIRVRRERERLISLGVVGSTLAIIALLFWRNRQASRVRQITEQHNAELEGVNVKLRNSNMQLEKASSAKTEFLATTSHEIRTPLNAVMNLTGAVLEKTPRGTDAHVKLATALRSAEHLHEIVGDVLDVARFEGKRVTANLTTIKPASVLGDVVNLWKSKAESKGLEFHTDLRLTDGDFITDEKLLRQVLSNLLSNAIKFTQQGSISLKVSGGSKAEPLRIEVKDTGIGIDQGDQYLIFESFRQVDTGGTRSFQGTGLGLAICRQITDLLKGSIRVESTLGEGATFKVMIPMAESESKPARSATTELKSSEIDKALADLDVLAAEDNAVNALVIQTILKGKVRSLTIVENGKEAVDAIVASRFDMVLMDKQMPVMDGVEAIKQIRGLKSDKAGIPIVAVTADAFAAAREELLEAGADDYLAKPVKPDDLKRSIVASTKTPRAEKTLETANV